MFQVNELSRPAEYSNHFNVKMTPQHRAKLRTIARMLGTTEGGAFRAVLDAVTVDDAPGADYAPTLEDVNRESE